MYLCILSLIGFPFLAGFYSKENILEGRFWIWKKIFFFSFLFSLILTSFYSFRLLFNCKILNWKKTLRGSKYFSLSSTLFLVFLTIFTGSHFKKVKKFFKKDLIAKFFRKFLVFFLVFLGGFLAFQTKKTFTFLYVSELKFLKSFKGSFFLKVSSEKIFFLQNTLDFGFKNSFIKVLKNILKKRSQFISELSLFFRKLNINIFKLLFIGFLIFVLNCW